MNMGNIGDIIGVVFGVLTLGFVATMLGHVVIVWITGNSNKFHLRYSMIAGAVSAGIFVFYLYVSSL